MADADSGMSERSLLRQKALSRWETEGGAWCGHLGTASDSDLEHVKTVPMSNAKLIQHHIRVIALENVVIALLSTASDQQLAVIREMAAYISPRPGFTPHPLTIHAANEMISLVERAGHFNDPQTTLDTST